ncbi:hypothetical protein [Singulisphaera sp. PoT]|uniref:hypothetical protein n=1 Tax=Singulisphaera sp. PoT TaxID=3411797 RepID=UPI003BF545CB
MRDIEAGDEEPREPSGLEVRLRSLADALAPDDLLARCLATIPEPEPASPARSSRWPLRVAMLATAAVVLLGFGLLMRPRPVDAAQLLSDARAAWTRVPASHRSERRLGADGKVRTVEIWFVRGRGYRQEIRVDDRLIGVTVANSRWKFQWDVPGRLIAAWSLALTQRPPDPDLDGLVLESASLMSWAEKHHAEIQVEPDEVDGRPTRRMILHWPGPDGESSLAQTTTVWFDRETHLPIREHRDLGSGLVIEERLDYPEASTVPDALLAFRPPRDVTLEINDPDLGRQVYSEGQAGAIEPDQSNPKGAER